MRKICKRIGTIVIAMSVFICSSLFAFAAEDEHYHNFMKCQQDGGEYKELKLPTRIYAPNP